MAKSKTPSTSKLAVDAFKHEDAKRTNIPTAEYQSVMREVDQKPIPVSYPRHPAREDAPGADPLAGEKTRRNRDLDPQLVWRGKDEQDWSDLVVHAPPLYIQEKVHPKAIIDDLRRWSEGTTGVDAGAGDHEPGYQLDFFSDFNGIPKEADKTDFYRHEGNWSNRLILGDSLQVMASLAEREGLRGKVQCIYLDPPYGIKFNSNFQWSTTSRDVKDGNPEHITREPEQVKAFRDTWRDGIHSYLTYLRDRLTVARDLLTDSGSIFVQIGDENVHRVRAVMDEIFGDDSFQSTIAFVKTSGLRASDRLDATFDYLIWYAKNTNRVKFRSLWSEKSDASTDRFDHIELTTGERRRRSRKDDAESLRDARAFSIPDLSKPGPGAKYDFAFAGKIYDSGSRWWGTPKESLQRLSRASRLIPVGKLLRMVRYLDDFPLGVLNNLWQDTGVSGFGESKVYVVQTNARVIERCILLSTDPSDLVLDPTCGSGTTAYVAEQWGRRWITIDTSRVALALARARIMGARYPYYLLADSRAGQLKEAEVTQSAPSSQPTRGQISHGVSGDEAPASSPTRRSAASRISGEAAGTIAGASASVNVVKQSFIAGVTKQELRDQKNAEASSNASLSTHHSSLKQGFVYERVPHITLKSIANNAEIDVIWDKWQQTLEPLRTQLEQMLGKTWEEWEIPREPRPDWPEETKPILAHWWEARIARQREIDASIAAKADFEYLYDKPYEDRKTVRVAGPFTVESLSPHRVLGLDENDDLIDPIAEPKGQYGEERDFVAIILDNLKTAGVQQAHKEDRINFTSLVPWPGKVICAEGRFGSEQWSVISGQKGAPPATDQPTPSTEKRAAIFIGPEFGTVSRLDLVEAAREAGDAGFDVLIACAFNYDAHSSEFDKLGRIPVLKARMNADLHMAEDLKNTGKGNLFVVFGEPDIEIQPEDGEQIRVKVNGVDVFHPSTGEVRSDGADGIACWFIDTDYNQEAFFVRHAYFLGANDPYKALATTLKAEIDPDAWASLNSDTSRPFPKPKSGRIAVKVINHLGDEVMKVFRV